MKKPTKLDELQATTAELAEIEARRNELRGLAAGLVIDALKEDNTPTEVTDASPFSAAHVRNLARMAGLPPAKRGGKGRD